MRRAGWGLLGIVLGAGLGSIVQACGVIGECSRSDAAEWSFDEGRAYRYGFDTNRAAFHDDADAEGTLSFDRTAGQVTIRYRTPEGEKVEIWNIAAEQVEDL